MTRKKLGEVGKDQKVLDQVARKKLIDTECDKIRAYRKKA